MKIVAFDPGLNLGWAVSEDVKKRTLKRSGCIKNDSDQPMLERQIYLTEFIEKLLEEEQPDVVIVEAVNRVGGGQVNNRKNESTWALYWIYGEILRSAGLKGIEVFPINPTTMKAAVTEGKRDPDAKGPAKKEEVMKVVKQIYGDRKMRSDESDAIGLAIAYWKLYTKEYIVGAKRKRK